MSSANSQSREGVVLQVGRQTVDKGVSDDAHAMPFDKLLHRPSGYRCSRLVDHCTPCPFSATATDAVPLVRSSFHSYKAYHYILVLEQGVRMVPPHVPSTKCMHDKGVYFDMKCGRNCIQRECPLQGVGDRCFLLQ